ncbi:helix-turn-helix domain-containing protein [Mesorhizobium sp. M0050]|uniref:helix-turn-helix domain-containing protein n=1 Tax=Mesorhizobium sp. M0050 TaxID=2956861 RepID=UPI00333B7847
MSDDHMAVAKDKPLWLKLLPNADLPASGYKVGLALLNRVNPDDGRCFPSASTLAKDCNILVRTAYDGIAALREVGLLETKKRFNGSLDFVFRLPPVTEKRETKSRKNGTACHENPGSNLKKEPSKLTLKDRRAGSGAPSADLRSAPAGPLASNGPSGDLFEESKRGCA